MSRWRPSRRARPALCGIGAASIAWRDAGALRLADPAEAASAFAAMSGTIDVVAGNDLAVHWMQQPPAAVRSLQELQLVAAARCAHLHGGAPTDWWVAADWSLRHPFVCAALPRATTARLQERARGASLRWHTAFGIVVERGARSLPDEGWSALRTPLRVLLWHCTRGRADALTGFAVAPDAPHAAVEAQVGVHLQLEAAASDSPVDQRLHWCASAGPAGGASTEAEAALALGQLLQGGSA